MKCPDCNKRLGCIDSRATEGGVKRIYQCSKCNKKHYTMEIFRDASISGKKVITNLEVQIRERVKRDLALALEKL